MEACVIPDTAGHQAALSFSFLCGFADIELARRRQNLFPFTETVIQSSKWDNVVMQGFKTTETSNPYLTMKNIFI